MKLNFNKTALIFAMSCFFVSGCNSGGATSAPESSVRTPIVLFTDLSFDDGMVISYLLRHQDKIKLEAISINGDGETYCQQGLNNAAAILKNNNVSNIQLACGASKPLKGNNAFPQYIRQEAVDAAAGNLTVTNMNIPNISGSEMAYNVIKNSSLPVEILEVGPQTDLAQLLINHPDIKSKIKQVFIMGGAINVPGNINEADPSVANTTAEFNYWVDPFAASIVMKSGLKLILVPLDFTNHIPLNLAFYNLIDSSGINKYHNFIKSVLNHKSIYSNMIQGFLYFWDLSAAVILLNKDKVANCNNQMLTVNNDYSSLYAGTISVDNKTGNSVQVCSSPKVSVKEFYDIFLK